MRAPPLAYRPTIPEMLRRITASFGASDAIVSRDRRLTYTGLEQVSRALAEQLVLGGVGKGTRVGLSFPNSPQWVAVFFAITRVGAVVVPMSSFYRPREMQKVLRLADVHTLLSAGEMFGTDQHEVLERSIPGLADAPSPQLFLPSVPALRAVWVAGGSSRPWATPMDDPVQAPDQDAARPVLPEGVLAGIEEEVAPFDLAVLVHTSGTSADPKGVFHTHGAVVRHAHQFSVWGSALPPQRYIGRGERALVSQAFFWVAGLMQELLPMLEAGGTLLVQDRFEVASAIELVRRERGTKVSQPTWGRLRSRPDALAALRAMEFLELPVATGPLYTGSGMTETLAHHAHAQDDFDTALPPDRSGGWGKPVPFMEHRIIDPDTGEELEDGTPGELLVRGYALMAGMNKREREEVFDPDGWYRTGDRCMLSDGYVVFLDRYGEMIKTSGANVSPPEVELVLLRMPEIAQAVVIGVPDPERSQVVAAAVVPVHGIELDVPSLLANAREELSAFKVPRRVLVFDDADFPRLANGKPDKRALTDLLAGAHDQPAQPRPEPWG